MRLLSGRACDLPPVLRNKLFAFRYRVFVEQLGWQLGDGQSRFERDEFDRFDTLYVVGQDARAEVVACARLLPTLRPCLLERHFSDLLAAPLQSAAHVWELSRFAVGRDLPDTDGLTELLAAVLEAAAYCGCDELVGVTFSSLARRFRSQGAEVVSLGPSRILDGRRVEACAMNIHRSLNGLRVRLPVGSKATPPIAEIAGSISEKMET
ncbi:acyl-homoserine-lactone synthase [Paraburkholderia lacunae]|uniref:Acyl-homoserine-lactone synthase n=1 Tax=Paraburkholderia lacunae TaxID=2211104 RepID=A0A370NAX5_9BURK|nr:acyl-homoserine-lactone synthase [Paraburkholderia lacunae]RDK02749.1 acyl-homoserine-lactone synthase [Paraburkholderia lacunae]